MPVKPAGWSMVTAAALAVAAVLALAALVPPRSPASPVTAGGTPAGPAPVTRAVPPPVTTTTGAPATVAAAPSVTWVAPQPGPFTAAPCRPADMSIATSTDAAAYAPGDAVVVTTTLRAERATCDLVLEPADGDDCASYAEVLDGAGRRAWPAGPVTCAVPAATEVPPGAGETVAVTWDPVDAPPGSYQAVGVWSWSAGPGEPPYVVEGAPADFTVS